jgi:hypothetical protein
MECWSTGAIHKNRLTRNTIELQYFQSAIQIPKFKINMTPLLPVEMIRETSLIKQRATIFRRKA